MLEHGEGAIPYKPYGKGNTFFMLYHGSQLNVLSVMSFLTRWGTDVV